MIILILLVSGWQAKSSVSDEIRLGGWDLNWMEKVKNNLNYGDPYFLPAYKQLIKDADEALIGGVYSVTFKEMVPPSGNKHDYLSMGPYWWPDPEKEDGLPYIRRDGEVNPERDKLDSSQKNKMINAVRSLTLAWYFSEEEKYAEKSAELLRVWFLDEETLMNPHLEYGQFIPGRTPGRFIGLIDMASLHTLVDAIALLETSEVMSKDEKEGIRSWFERYFRWLIESSHGKQEDDYKNNHSVAYDLQSSGIAYYIGDDDFVARKVRELPRRRIDPMIEEDGRQPHELIRTKAFGYSVSNLGNLFRVGEKGLNVGVDVFDYKNVKGGSMQKALDYLIQYVGREEDWPYEQISGWEHTEDNLGMIVRKAARIYEDEKYRKLWKDTFYDRLKTDWSLLVIPEMETKNSIVIDETDETESIVQTIKIDSVWAGHPVGFSLYTHGDRQYIAYYNDERRTVVGQRNLSDDEFQLHVLPATSRETHRGTSTVVGWDSHNYLTIGIDKEGFIHLSGNVHVDPLTYFRSTKPNDISTLEQIFEMVGTEEDRTTYPHFMLTKENELLYHYRDGGSGNGNEIYNIYNCETKTWSRMLDVPLTDGQGLMNAYQTQPTVMKDGWYHMYWVWRDTPDCSTNHDLSYMKSPDLKTWYNAYGEKIKIPATIEDKSLIVDPIPVQGGIINLAAKLVLDEENNPVFVYHKFGTNGNTQFFTARLQGKKWIYKQITDWNYRWYFSGNGSINSEIRLKGFQKREDGFYEVSYWHIKYGNGTILLNDNFENIGKVLKPEPFANSLEIEGAFPGLQVRTAGDLGDSGEQNIRYVLKWETINRNRDRPRPKPWPEPSQLYLYKLRK
ncbi:MAG TPA: BNR-4 repeat-containing protein [Bacteroidales bacterium]|nr:BNR-4 repeat-containing protein [Bacteroidales bacterium]